MAAIFLALQLSVLPASAQSGPSRDMTFGNKGAAFLNLYDSLAELGVINDYVLDGAGNTYVLVPRTMTEVNGISDKDVLIVKINPAGKLDSTFNGMGYTVDHNASATNFWQPLYPYNRVGYLQVSNDGSKITVYQNSLGNVISTYRVTKDGLPDDSYGSKGCKNINLGLFVNTLQEVKTTADGGVLLYTYRSITQDSIQSFIIKLDAEGNIDPSFNSTGKKLSGDGSTPYYVGSLSLPTGGFLTGTRVARYNYDELYTLNWVKYNANGSIDSSFGSNGLATIPVNKYTPASQFSSVHSILLADNSQVTMLTWSNQIIQFKLTPAGIIDSSFGINGMNKTSFGLANGFIGRYTDPTSLYFWTSRTTDSAGYVIMRIKPDGYIDSSFMHHGGRYIPDPQQHKS